MKSMYKVVIFAFLLALALSVASSHAQIVGATITGVVRDSSGAALSSATVTAKQT